MEREHLGGDRVASSAPAVPSIRHTRVPPPAVGAGLLLTGETMFPPCFPLFVTRHGRLGVRLPAG